MLDTLVEAQKLCRVDVGQADSALELFAFGIEDVTECGLLQGNGLDDISDRLAAGGLAWGDNGHTHYRSTFLFESSKRISAAGLQIAAGAVGDEAQLAGQQCFEQGDGAGHGAN